ncbi:MAG TPA: Xaa-Pro peptidase family protein [Bacteroidales bacterium]
MSRLSELLHQLKDREVNGYFTSSVSNITYLTGFTGDSSRLFVSPKRCVLMTDARYVEQARMECPSEVEVFQWIDNKRYAIETYRHIMNVADVRKMGIEATVLSHAEYETLKNSLVKTVLVSIDGTVEKLRQEKDMHEIENLRKACLISDKALEQTIPFIREGVTELELTARLEFNLKTNGAENLSFDSLIISGARTSLLHGKPSQKKLEYGDLVLLDFGALYQGYHADISRTFILGKPSEQQKEIYHIIEKAQMEGVKSLTPDISSHTTDRAVRSFIPEKYIAFYYPGLGHGVGLELHEEPFLGQNYNEYMLKKNMTITIEPGIYIPGWGGIRIEDTVLITEHGPESLTRFPRELTVL